MMSEPSSPWVVLADYRWKTSCAVSRSPIQEARGNEKKTTKQDRKPPPTQEPSDPRPQGDPGAHSVGQPPDRGGHAEQPTARPRSQRCKREVLLDNRECKAAVEARRGKTAGPTPGAQTVPLSTDRVLTLPAWCGKDKLGPAFACGFEKERTKTKIKRLPIPSHAKSCECAQIIYARGTHPHK